MEAKKRGRTQNLKPWPKGVSGNPGGRPKKKPITEIYEEVFSDPSKRKEIKDQVFKTMSTKGMAGVLERREAAERLEGKVTGSVDVNMSGRVTLEQVLEAKKRADSGWKAGKQRAGCNESQDKQEQ